MSERSRSAGLVASLTAGLVVGVVEVVLATGLAVLVFSGRVVGYVTEGVGLYLGAAAVTLAIMAWRAGRRGVVGGLQAPLAAVLAVVSTYVGLSAFGGTDRAFLTVIAATLVVTVGCGVVFLVLGTARLGNLVRYVPYPVVGGFLAGTGWLLFKGGIYVASGVQPALRTAGDLVREYELTRWAPAFVFGVAMLLAVRVIRRPMVIPAMLGIGLVVFLIGAAVTAPSLEEVRAGRWLLGPFESARLWEPWTLRALSGADWSAVLGQWAGIATAVFVAALAILFNVSGTEIVLHRDLDTNRELRDAGVLNLVSGALGGIPGYHALSLTALAQRMSVDARVAGLIAAAVPAAAVIFGASVIELIPRMLVGGVLVFLGLAFIVEWVWDKRRTLPPVEYAVVLVILAGIIARGFLPGVALGLVLAVVLFAVSYGRIELVREVAFGETYRSNVDRPPAERALLRTMAGRVQILRVHGFVFFGSASGLLSRIGSRVDRGGLRFLLLDVRRVSGVDASAVVAFVKVVHLAESSGFELVFAGASGPVREQLRRGGVSERDGVVAFEPDLDRALQRAEDVLLAEVELADLAAADGHAGMPEELGPHLERLELAEGQVLLRQDEAPEDLFVLESGRLRVEMATPEGRRMRLRTVLPGVVVGEVGLYTGEVRTADVVAEVPSVVLRLSQAEIEAIAARDPALAARMHRWLASTLAVRLGDTLRSVDALLD